MRVYHTAKYETEIIVMESFAKDAKRNRYHNVDHVNCLNLISLSFVRSFVPDRFLPLSFPRFPFRLARANVAEAHSTLAPLERLNG